MARLVLLLGMSQRKRAKIIACLTPALAEVEGLLLVAVNVRTWMLNFSRLDYLDAAETLRSLHILRVLESFMPASECSLDGLGDRI